MPNKVRIVAICAILASFCLLPLMLVSWLTQHYIGALFILLIIAALLDYAFRYYPRLLACQAEQRAQGSTRRQ